MSNIPFRFLQRRTSTSGRTPDVESLLNGELYVQLADETIYFKNDKCQLVSVVTSSSLNKFGTGSFITTGMTGNFGGSANTGSLTGIFAPIGNYVTTGQTGSFITTSMTGAFGGNGNVDLSDYVTTGSTGSFVTMSQTGAFAPTGDYVIASATGSFVTTSQTGAFAPTGDYVFANATGSFVTTSQTGAFAPTGDYVTIIDGHVPSQYLPSYVDDIEEFDTTGHLYEHSGERGHIYLVSGCNSFWRWGGSQYVEIFGSPGTSDGLVEGLTNLYFTTERSVCYVTTGNTGTFVTTSQTGQFAPNGSYVITSQTGIFAPSGSYVTTSQTGAFAPSGSYVITSQTGIFETSGYARTCYVTTGQTGNFGAGDGLGYGQTWQLITRNKDQTYTNNTSKPIMVSLITLGCCMALTVQGVIVGIAQVGANSYSTVSAIVPPDATYSATHGNNTCTTYLIRELR